MPPLFSQNLKKTDLSGTWYSRFPLILNKQIKDFIKKTDKSEIKGDIIALISPHAGINYSGQTASYGVKAIADKRIDKVIVVGFSHKLAYDGIAVFDKDGVKTPLGILYTDKDLVKKITAIDSKIFPDNSAFKNENSLELILPFIQQLKPEPKILLLAIGKQSFSNCQILASGLYEILKSEENYLIIASSDLSHYLPDSLARKTDAETVKLISRLNSQDLYAKTHAKNRMCGTAAVVSTMIAAKKLGADKFKFLHSSTSAEASESKDRVVGYLSAALVNTKAQSQNKKEGQMNNLLSKDQKKELISLVRRTITLYINEGKVLEEEPSDPALNEVMGVFVTLRNGLALRGCIGNIIGKEPLYKGVIDMAIAASSRDSRFQPVSKDELDDIDIEVSVLSPPRKIDNPDDIILGKHGVLVKDFFRSGVYLPQVATETGWDKEQFMNSLCAEKAGMEPSAWKTGKCDIFVFTAEVFSQE
tara:strand:+ start:603 stop:2027 length:1425 start_codon:yes stop_codon:yes gene_type:complete